MTVTGSILIPAVIRGMPGNAIPLPELIIDATGKGEKYVKFWTKCVGAGRANEGLRAGWLEQLALVKKHCGFEYVRFHGLFHDDMFVYKEVNGKPVYNWQYIDELFDRMLAIGVKPFVELGFMPKDLSIDDSMLQFWWKGHVSPPKDYGKWAELVAAFTRHCISRYGIEEVKTWYFEVWNEPNLRGFWLGTRSQYFELYKVSAQAIKSIDPRLRVGGPSTSNFVPDDRFEGELEDKTRHKTLVVEDINQLEWKGVWIIAFLQYCKKEKLPVDFVSCHPYPTDWALDPTTGKGGGRVRKVNATKEDLQWLQDNIRNSDYPDAELHCTEWSSSPSSRDATHDSLQAATYIIKANVDGIGLTDSLSYWTFTDIFEEKGGGDTMWHGGFGMINYQGIVKPSFHAYRMLNRLGNEVLYREEGVIITRFSQSKRLVALLYHYPKEVQQVVEGNVEDMLNAGKPRTFTLKFNRLRSLASVTIETLDRNNGFAITIWKEMGMPQSPDIRQTAALKKAAFATKTERAKGTADGKFIYNRELSPWTCVLIELV